MAEHEKFEQGRPSDVLRNPELTPTVLSKGFPGRRGSRSAEHPYGGYTGEENSSLKPPPGVESAAIQRDAESNNLVIKVKVDADDAVKGFKRIQREARKTSQALRELEQQFDRLQQQGLIVNPLPTSPPPEDVPASRNSRCSG